MKISKLSVLKGANVFSYKPVLWIKLSLGAYVDTPSSKIAGFVTNLVKALPGLKEHQCSLGRSGGFVERLYEGTYLAHIFEHVTLELQNLCGDKVSYGKARASEEAGVYDVIIAYKTEAVAKRCAYLAEKFLNALIEGAEFPVDAEIKKINDLCKDIQLGPSAEAIYQAALARGIPAERFAEEDLIFLGQGKYGKRIWSAITGNTSLLATDLVANKYLTTKLLMNHHVPVPENSIVESEAEALAYFRVLGGSVVAKPLSGSHGRGVTVDITHEAGLKRAFQLARIYGDKVLIERYITGRQYRFCMVNHKLAAAAERIPAYVIGDGQHTVEQLVALANRNPLRGDGHEKPLTKMVIDEATLAVLAKQALTPRIVPEVKRVVQIKETANISTGGTAVDVTALVHPDNILLAERISQIIGLDIAGLDIIAADITKPLTEENGAVIEVNAAPGIRMHHHPSAGPVRDVGGAIVDYLFPYHSDGRIPVIAVTGTNGKTTTARMLSSIFRQAGYAVGMSTTEGIFLNEKCLLKGDCSGPASAKMVLSHPEAEVAVLETARGGIVRAGLGFDRCDVGVLTNISEDHLGQDGIETLEDLAHIKSLVLEMVAVSGTAVINADDVFALNLASRVQADVIYFSLEPHNIIIRRHLGLGGRAVFVRNGMIYLAEGSDSEALFHVTDMPITLGGKAKHNIENALVAISAAFGYGLAFDCIKKGLENFSCNLGRLNIFDVMDFKVCIDYGHNLAGYQAILDTARQLKVKRIVGIIAAPGDRRDDVIFNIGRTAGAGFDRLYIKEDADLRGRKPGETAQLLKNGALSAGFAEKNVFTILSEAEAVKAALDGAVAGDLLIVFYESYDMVTKTLQAFIEEQDLAESKVPEMLKLMDITENNGILLKNPSI